MNSSTAKSAIDGLQDLAPTRSGHGPLMSRVEPMIRRHAWRSGRGRSTTEDQERLTRVFAGLAKSIDSSSASRSRVSLNEVVKIAFASSSS